MSDPVAAARELGPRARRAEIVAVLGDAFGELMVADPAAFHGKFRKMAASPLAFYRGSAPLFYSDMAREAEPPGDERAARVWIQGDLHAENFGVHMSSGGRLVFDVNDFDEAYLGHFGWDLRRLAASLALIGYARAFSDAEIERLVAASVSGYVEQVRELARGEAGHDFALTLANTTGAVHAALERARTATRAELLDRLTVVEGCERRLIRGDNARDLDAQTREQVEEAHAAYLRTLPDPARHDEHEHRIKDVVASRGFGIGSAGLPAFTLLLEGATDALETDIVLSMKQGNVAAPSRIVTDEHIRSCFEHHGQRTALAQRALQANTDPWLGYTSLAGTGFVVKELSPYEADLDWSQVIELEELRSTAHQLGRATAKVHVVADAHAEDSLVPFAAEEAIEAAVGGPGSDFVAGLVRLAVDYAELTRDDHRYFVDAFRNGEIPGL